MLHEALSQLNGVRQLLPFQLGINKCCPLCQGDGIQMEVSLENGRAASESSGEGTGETAQKHILACETKASSVIHAK